ncbi:MAG: PIN domain-containing protein [Verrucomicrobiales bacterium]|nr:PIN domain-containing protein [Verrucomicrobiales bacterium]
MVVYADICTLCRPFDDQSQPRIWLETHALCVILALVEQGALHLCRSRVHELENARNPSRFRRGWVEGCLNLSEIRIPISPTTKRRAEELEQNGLNALDALHAASAEEAGCDFLLTCDDRFLKRYRGSLAILNPADFVVRYFQQSE